MVYGRDMSYDYTPWFGAGLLVVAAISFVIIHHHVNRKK